MKRIAMFFFLLLMGCVNPSTMLIDRDGRFVRCATTGYGYGVAGAIAVTTALQSHNRCVEDAKLVGFVPMPRVQLGFEGDTKKIPMPIMQLTDNTKDSGLAIGDLIMELDDKKIGHVVDVLTVLNTKSVGDNVKVKVQRNNQMFVYSVKVIER